MSRHSDGTAYVTVPDSGKGPGVLVLHAWWGLTPFFRGVCDRLAEAGFVALAPDLFEGRTADDPDEGRAMLADADINANLSLVTSSLMALQRMPATPAGPVGTLGFSMGASWALYLASRIPDRVAATAVFYGSQNVDMAPATSSFIGHFAETDDLVDEDELTLLEADLRLLDKDVTFHRYPGTTHWFFEADRPAYEPEAAEVAWDRTISFFREHLASAPTG